MSAEDDAFMDKLGWLVLAVIVGAVAAVTAVGVEVGGLLNHAAQVCEAGRGRYVCPSDSRCRCEVIP